MIKEVQGCKTAKELGFLHGIEDLGFSYNPRPCIPMSLEDREQYEIGYKEARFDILN